MTPEEYLSSVRNQPYVPFDPWEFIRLVEEYLERKKKKEKALGYIDDAYVSGRPQVVLDGEAVPSDKEYPYIDPKTWVAGDRVALELFGDTWVVVGKVV